MNAGDQPFYFAALRTNLYEMAKVDGINKGLKGKELNAYAENLYKNPSVEMAERAKAAAEKAVLSQDNAVAAWINKGASKFPVVSVLAPFTKVPTNFLARTLDFTPAGAVLQGIKQARAGKFDQRALSEALAEATTGTAVIFMGAELANNDLLSGQYPTGDQKEVQRWKAEGIQPNSVKIGNKWVSLNYLGPAGLLLGAGKDYHDAAANGDSATLATIAGLGKNLTGQSFLTGFSGFANAINDPQRSAKTFVNSEVGSIIPTWSGDTANSFDKYQREVNNPGDALRARIPAARNNLNVKRDVYGNDLTQRTDALNMFFNPLRPSNTKSNPVIAEVSRLHYADTNNSDLQVTPTAVKKTLKIEGQEYKLDNDQLRGLQKNIGQNTQEKWGELIKTPEYKALSDPDKAAALDNVRKAATEFATREYVVNNNIATYRKQISAKGAGLENGTVDIASFAKNKGEKTASAPKATTTKAKTTKTKVASTKKASTKKSSGGRKSNYSFADQIARTASLSRKAANAKVKKATLNVKTGKANIQTYKKATSGGKIVVKKKQLARSTA
jgi:hypothetical protein